MGRESNGPLTPAEAKQRLRAAAREVGIAAWVRRHPLKALAGGVIVGYLLGGMPARTRQSLVPPLLKAFLSLTPLAGGNAAPRQRRRRS